MERPLLLEIAHPGGGSEAHTVVLDKERYTIGRYDDNDIVLQRNPECPDLDNRVTRHQHCVLSFEGGAWWLEDKSTCGTFVERHGRPDEAVEPRQCRLARQRAQLRFGDVILVPGREIAPGQFDFWRLAFLDPTATIPRLPTDPYLMYDWAARKLYRVLGPWREEIEDLRPQEGTLVRFMDTQNAQIDYRDAVACSLQEITEAVWGDPPELGPREEDIRTLVRHVRAKIEIEPKEPRLLELVAGFGYRLYTRRFQG